MSDVGLIVEYEGGLTGHCNVTRDANSSNVLQDHVVASWVDTSKRARLTVDIDKEALVQGPRLARVSTQPRECLRKYRLRSRPKPRFISDLASASCTCTCPSREE